MKKILVLLFIFSCFVVNAQLTIKGRVIDELNEPLTYVNVIVANTTKGVVTDDNGEFTISNIEKRSATLEISYLGFVTREIKVNKRTPFLKIVLKE